MLLAIVNLICQLFWWSGVFLGLCWIYKEVTMGICTCKKRLDGKVVLVTGATGGIGYETALELAKRGAEVIVASRNEKKCQSVCQRISRISGNTKVHARRLDLSSQMDVKRFASSLLEDFPEIHCLVNNAGVIGDHGHKLFLRREGKRTDTKDGFETIMATNYLGPFALTDLLIPTLKSSGTPESPSRIINVSSKGHMGGRKDITDLNSRRIPFDADSQYTTSKLMQIHHSNAMAKRFAEAGANIQAASLHPGLVLTDILRDVDPSIQSMFRLLFRFFGKNCRQGAQTSIHCVLTDEDINGKYYGDCRVVKIFKSNEVGNRETEEKLYAETKKLLGLK